MVHYVQHFQTTGSHYFKHEYNLKVLHNTLNMNITSKFCTLL